MKAKYILLSFCLLGSASLQAQSISFENEAEYTGISVYDTWEKSPFRTGVVKDINRYAAIVDNPNKEIDEVLGDAPNPSDKVLAVQRSRFGSNTFGARIDLPEPIALGNATKYVHVMVYKPAGETTPVLLTALGKRTDWPYQSKEAEQLWVKTNNEIVSGKWNDVVFGITTNPNVELHSLVVVPDLTSPHNRTSDFVAYIDEIEISDSPVPRFSLTNYPVNFDKNQAYTRSDRQLTNISVSGAGTSAQSFSTGTQTVYRDLTQKKFVSAQVGDELTVKLTQSGTWMSGYIYVDWDNDGKFEPVIENNVPAEGSELVSFTHLNGYNSKGVAGGGNNISGGVITCPSFTIPEGTPTGVYRMRCKVDWDCEDPGGNTTSANSLLHNGGGIVDVLLNIHEDEVKISANQLNGDVLNADSTTLVSSLIPYGKAHTILMDPAPGFIYKGVAVTHGYNLDGEQFIKDNMQWRTDTVPASKFKENNTYALPIPYINGEVRIEGLFDIDTGGGGGEESKDYPINVEKDQPNTRSDRYLKSVAMGSTSYAVDESLLYNENMGNTFCVKPGEEVSAQFSYTGSWMHGYVYIDKGQDGAFNCTVGEEGKIPEESDVMTFAYWSGDNTQGESGYNSLGEAISGSARNVLNPPSFTIPELKDGFYRIRFKVDWNEIDAGGNMTEANSIIHNGGGIADMRLSVHASDEVNVKVGECAHGSVVASPTTAFGEDFTVTFEPEADYELAEVKVVHGKLDGDSVVHSVPQRMMAIFTKEDLLSGTELLIPGSMVDGDLQITVTFKTDYPVNVDRDQPNTRSDRYLKGVAMGSTSYAVDESLLYNVNMENTFCVKSGEEVSAQFSYAGSWMHGYVYIDKGQDGAFNCTVGEEGKIPEESDIMTFAYWSGDNTQGESGYNSLGEAISGSARNVLNPPSFTIPELKDGFYRIRFKVDWNEIDAGGNVTDKNHIINNGGGIADMRLRVFNSDAVNVTVDGCEHGQVVAEATAAFGQDYTMSFVPEKGYELTEVRVLHGNLQGDSIIHSVPQRLTTVFTADDILLDDELQIPGSMVDGDMVITAVFTESTGINRLTNTAVEPAYDLTGRRVGVQNKGIRIQGGKKILK